MRQRLYAALADRQGDHTIPYARKFNQGAVFRHSERSAAAEFPEKWLREGVAPDRWEHILPDGPGKAEQLEVIDQVLKDR
jgi:hypothetical protein